MDKNKQTESMLAEALEEKEQVIQNLAKENRTLKENLKFLSEKQAPSSQSMVTWEDYQKEIKAYKKQNGELVGKYLELKSGYDRLKEERRYWATQQWTKHLFRWLFLKRHLWFFLVFVVYGAMLMMLFYSNEQKTDKINRLHQVDLKYRFIRTIDATAPFVNLVDSMVGTNNPAVIEHIHRVVTDYEESIKRKCDSIVRAENKKMEHFL